ncbi:probable fructokinase-4 [Ipomoea triloba]|uniref:probable fructokinase-4 n=1 Tax=Ipomoea triloba TaxID=35885 RepID=UPI00125E83D1|nr:probable fructokinase-4 [Ipomoea triloba]
MHHQAIIGKPTLVPANGLFSHPHPTSAQNPRLAVIRSVSPNRSSRARCSVLNNRGIEIPAPKLRRFNDSGEDRRLRAVGVKDIDVATLGNLCVDIVLNVPKLPPKPHDKRKAYMDELSKTPPDKEYWEAGGNSNVAIAAARLGLCCTTIGHVGNDVYGRFFLDVLHSEGISMVGMNEPSDDVDSSSAAYETLLCWVLVDPLQRHGFCSRADFSEDPVYSWMTKLSAEVKMAIKRSKILFCNGYDFDELSPSLLESALDFAVEAETSIFFDPGPRVTLVSGRPEEQRAVDKFFKMSDVLLLTSEEAESLTGIENPIMAGQELLKKGARLKWVIVKMGAKGSILITKSSITCAPGFKVDVIDTVGCGDSFVAAVAFGFIHNVPLVYTLTLANAVGGATAMGCGAGRNVATLEQVKELMRRSDINEDEKLWEELLSDSLGTLEVNLLLRSVIDQNSPQLNVVPLQRAVSEILPKLLPAQSKMAVASSLS